MGRDPALRRTAYLVKAGSHAYGTALPGCRLHEAGLRWPGNGEDELAALRRLPGG